jgi:lambda repressor-like predicted transcriptional regulator
MVHKATISATKTARLIKSAMIKKGVSQKSIAIKCKVAPAHVWAVIHGRRNNPKVRRAIARSLGVHTKKLWPPDNA